MIDGKLVSKKITEWVAREVKDMTDAGHRKPFLGVILIGDNPASKIYVGRKETACREVGFDTTTIRFDEDVPEDEVIQQIREFNNNPNVDGILVQLPLPEHMDFLRVFNELSPHKDIDGLTPHSQGLLALNRAHHIPCTPKGIIKLIKAIDFEMKGVHAAVVGRSALVGSPIAKLLTHHHATVTTVHSRTKNPWEFTSTADLLVVAAGVPKLVDEKWVKKDAVVIDVGIHRVDDKICGDVDFDRVKEKASWITPVPGGVGPMTIAALLTNCFNAYKTHVS